ncbi:MAG: DUF1638 domain-containing protein [Desulfitobacteriaceae bacterium]
MKAAVIACNVLRDQIESLGEWPYKFIYLEQGLHRTPERLSEQLQETVNACAEFDVLLFGYGLCSRAVIGLQGQPHQTLVIPRIDDCIGISMGGRKKFYEEFTQHPGTYYFTKGWVEAAEDPLKEYHKVVAKYGEEIAEWTAKESLKHYERTVMIKTADEVHEPSKAYVQEFARFFNLRYEEMKGAPTYLRQLLLGSWDKDFVIVTQGKVVDDDMFKDRQ